MNEVESLALEAELEVSGTRGYSAYEIAQQQGFEGTVDEWLESLKGEDGKTGDVGPQGPPGITPDMRIGTVETLDPGEDAYANFIGTPAVPILNMGIPQGETGNGIASWTKTGTSGLVDTYTITYTDGTTTTLNVTNGKSIVSITKTTTSGLTDTYAITYNDNTTSTFNVTNGRSIVTVDLTSTVDNVDTYTITYNDGTTSTFNVTNSTVTNQEFEAVKADVEKYKTLSNLLPKVEGEGNPVTLNNTVEGVTMDITPEGATSQHTTTGKNLLQNNAISQTINGVTFTKNEDGTIKVNGTATAQAIYNINEGVVLNGTYIITGCPSGSADATYFLQIYGTGGVNEYGNGATTSNINAVVRIVIRNGATLNNLIFKPMIRLSSITDDTYEEYTNGQPSPSPDYPQPIKVVTGEQNVNVSGKNLFNKENYIDNYYIGANGSHVYQNGDFIGDYINVNTGNYIASGSPNIIRCATYDKDKNFIRRELSTNGSSLLITITSEEKFVRLSGYKTSLNTLQFEPGSTATTTYTPYYSKDYPLSFGSWNLLNYDLETESYYYDSSGNKTYDNSFKYINQRIEVGLGSSITCTAESMTSNALMRICEFASNDLFIKRSLVSTTERTITLNTNTSYIIVSIDKSNDRYFLKPQITKGTDIKPYYPYGEHYNENPLELAKIGDYQDYIYGTPNNWYKGKYVNSKEVTVYNVNTSYSNLVYATISKPNDYLGKANYGDYKVLFEKGEYLYKTGNTWDTTEYINKILPNGNNNLFYFGLPLGTTKEQAEEILNGTKLYYPIEPTTEPITDTTLIEQLNNLYNATSQEGTTIITCSSASSDNETLQVKVSTYKDISSILNPVVESEGE